MVIINLFTEETSVKYGSWGGANSFNPNNQVDNDDKYYVLPENFCVIEGREGGNHPIHARMIVRPDMISKYLPAKTGITERQQYIIDVLGCLTSAGRKEEFNSYGHIPPSKEEYAILENLGLIKITKAGAVSLTTEGKNNRSRSGMLKYVAP
jgi:hypothetical protein